VRVKLQFADFQHLTINSILNTARMSSLFIRHRDGTLIIRHRTGDPVVIR